MCCAGQANKGYKTYKIRKGPFLSAGSKHTQHWATSFDRILHISGCAISRPFRLTSYNRVRPPSPIGRLTLLCIFIFPKRLFQWNVYHQSLWFQHISTMRYFWHWAISAHSITTFSLTIIAVTTDHKFPTQAPWYLVTHISSQIKSNKCEIPKNYEKNQKNLLHLLPFL